MAQKSSSLICPLLNAVRSPALRAWRRLRSPALTARSAPERRGRTFSRMLRTIRPTIRVSHLPQMHRPESRCLRPVAAGVLTFLAPRPVPASSVFSSKIDDVVWSIEPLPEWADRDEHDHGLGDMPYPANFPKQDGEPCECSRQG